MSRRLMPYKIILMEGYLATWWNQQIDIICRLERQLGEFQIKEIEDRLQCCFCQAALRSG